MRENSLRLVRRYAAEGSAPGYEACARLLVTVTLRYQDDALTALDMGLAERAVSPGGMGMAGLFDSVAIPERGTPPPNPHFEPLTQPLADAISIRLACRPGRRAKVAAREPRRRRRCVRKQYSPRLPLHRPLPRAGVCCSAFSLIMAPPGSVPVALDILEGHHPIEVQSAALDVAGPPRRRQSRVEASVSTRWLRSVSEGGCATSCSPGRRPPEPFWRR